MLIPSVENADIFGILAPYVYLKMYERAFSLFQFHPLVWEMEFSDHFRVGFNVKWFSNLHSVSNQTTKSVSKIIRIYINITTPGHFALIPNLLKYWVSSQRCLLWVFDKVVKYYLIMLCICMFIYIYTWFYIYM